MASVSLDGLVVALAHALELEEAAARIDRAARDLAEGSLARHAAKISRPAPGRLLLVGGTGGVRFEAAIDVQAQQVAVALTGSLSLSFIEVTLAGGEVGVRRRVAAEVERALRERLDTP